MPSKYFELTTKSKKFKEETKELIKSLEEQNVVIYGAGQGFFELNKTYNFNKNLHITAIADKKFETQTSNITGLKQITPRQVLNENYEKILITNEQPRGVLKFLTNTLGIPQEKLLTIFNEEIKEEALSLNYLYEHKFDKTLTKLVKKLKNKSVVIYGAGIYFEAILKYFDLSGLNIIGVCDKRFEGHKDNEQFKGYKVYAPSEIKDAAPDYVLVATKFYISLIMKLNDELLKGSKIKIRPLVQKSLWTLLKEIWT